MRHSLFLLRELVKRDFQARYAGSALGFVWSFVQPLWQLVLFSFVFSMVLRIPLTGEATDSFGIFLFCGLLPWLAISEGVQRSATAITDNSSLVKKLRFPAEILVFSVVASSVVHQLIATVLFAVILAVRGDLSMVGAPLLLIALVLQVALSVGIGLILAAVQVFLRDASQVLGMVMAGWFYLTPIVYPLAQVPESVTVMDRFQLAPRALIELNPLTPLVGLYRNGLLGDGWALPPGLWTTGVFAAASLGLGWWLFHRLKPAFVDEI